MTGRGNSFQSLVWETWGSMALARENNGSINILTNLKKFRDSKEFLVMADLSRMLHVLEEGGEVT